MDVQEYGWLQLGAATTRATIKPIPMTIPAKPMMMPAKARPPLCCVPPDRLIWERAMNPKMMARMAPTPQTQKNRLHTSEAMARPLVPPTGAYP